jgi:hypothetical protein
MLKSVEYDEHRFAEIVLYVAKKIESDPTGGATKLNKILFFADFAFQRAHGHPITGAEYQRLKNGPAPRRLKPVREALINAGAAVFRKDDYFSYPLDRLVAKREPAPDLLSEEEQGTLDGVISSLWARTATEVSELSHKEMAWQLVDDGQTIPYEYAYVVPPVLTPTFRESVAGVEQRYAPQTS